MTLRELCRAHTVLSNADIIYLETLAGQLPMIADLTGTDIFIDCPTTSGEVVVVSHARPSWKVGAYSENVVGQYALCANEPAVFEALLTNTQIRDIKAVTQENRSVKQDVVPINGENRDCIAVLIRETDITETLVQEKKFRQLSKCFESMDTSLRNPEPNEEYDIRLREVHHRIKNNLQIIASILNLQARGCKDESIKDILHENVGRVLTIASIHDILTKEGMAQNIDCLTLMNSLKQNLSSFVPYGKSIAITVEGDSIIIGAETASSVALVVNELITNALQHAFEDRDCGEIKVFLIAGKLINSILVSDNGCGYVPSACTGSSFGLKIVESTVRDKLHGHLRINSDSTGTRVSFDFKTE